MAKNYIDSDAWCKKYEIIFEINVEINPYIYSWGKKDSTKRYLWSKIILTTGSVGEPGVDPPPRKINTFFLRPLALSVPIYRHFQSNGANWRSSKHLTKKFI